MAAADPVFRPRGRPARRGPHADDRLETAGPEQAPEPVGQGEASSPASSERPGLGWFANPVLRATLLAFQRTRATVARSGDAVAGVRSEPQALEAPQPAPPAPEPEIAPIGAENDAPSSIARDAPSVEAQPEPPAPERPASRPPGEPAAAALEETRRAAAEPDPLSAAKILQFGILAALAMAISAAGAYAVAAQGERVYAARSEILFDLHRLPWGTTERFLETQIVVAQSRTILSPIAATHGVAVSGLERDLSVSTVRDSNVLRLEYRHPDRFLAQGVTAAITDRYLVSLREFELRDGPAHRLLSPAFVLEQPVSPEPLRAAALGAVIGLVIAVAAAILRTGA